MPPAKRIRALRLGAQITAADAITYALLLVVTGKTVQIPLYAGSPTR